MDCIIQDMMSRPPIFEPSTGFVTRAGEAEKHEYSAAEQPDNTEAPPIAGDELYDLISHLSNLTSEKYAQYGDTADPYEQNDDDIDTFTPQEVLQATRLIRMLKQSMRSSQYRQRSRPLRLNDGQVDSRASSFGAGGTTPTPCPKGNNDRSPKRGDSFGFSPSSRPPAGWEQGEFQALISGMKASAQEAATTVRQRSSTETRQPEGYLDSQPASSRMQSLGPKRFSENLNKAAASKYATASCKETPRVVASFPRPQQAPSEQTEILASRGTFEQTANPADPLIEKFLAGSQGNQIAPFPTEALVGDEPHEIQECPYCHRTFASKSFDIHVKVCVKVFFTRRKKYDMTRKRLASVVDEAGLPVHSTVQKLRGELASKPLEKPTEKKWQRESAQFRAAMRMARAGDPREIAEAQAIFAKCSDMGVNKQCQHCGRTFGRDEALEKHEGVCQRMFKNGGGILRKGGGLCAAQGAACRQSRNAAAAAAAAATAFKKKGQQRSMEVTAPKRNIDPASWAYQHRSGSQNSRGSKGNVTAAANYKKANAALLQQRS